MSYTAQWFGGPKDGVTVELPDNTLAVSIVDELKHFHVWLDEVQSIRAVETPVKICPVHVFMTPDGRYVSMIIWPTIRMDKF